MPWHLAQRTQRMNPSAVREILKLADRPGVISLAGGFPSPASFPVEALREATARVLHEAPHAALQYAASEGLGPLRDWVADHLRSQGFAVQAAQVLITTGSQQGLDLVAKLLVDPGSRVAVESPTYLGALQAFAVGEPEWVELAGDDEGALPEALAVAAAAGARFCYTQPNFQNPTGRCMSAARRTALARAAQHHGLPLLEDNPYGELWFDTPPPAPLASLWPEGTIYLGSFSKVLAPGLRLGYLVAPAALFPKLLHAKQAADLHTPGFNQRVVLEVLRSSGWAAHGATLRARYQQHRDAMQRALATHLPEGCHWQMPHGGLFFWVRLPPGCDTQALLPRALTQGVAYVPGASFYASEPDGRTLRLSYATASPEHIEQGVKTLAAVLAEAGPWGQN